MSDGKVHSEIGASSAERWFNCAASVRLSKGIPNVSSVYADNGSRAHEVASNKLEGKPFENLSDEEMMAVDTYVDYVQDLWKNLPRHHLSKIMIEHRFNLEKIYRGLFGTCDCVIYDGAAKTLHVIDYKHGMGVPVSPEDNVQLKYYGLGALLSLEIPIETVVLTIVQPRYSADSAIKSWSTDNLSMLDFSADLATFAAATEDPKAEPISGEWCKFCRAKAICPALKESAKLAVAEEFAVENLQSLTPRVLGGLLSQVESIENWIRGVREYAYNEAKAGRMPEGFKLVAKRAVRKWANPELAAKSLEKSLISNVFTTLLSDPELKSPAQVEKILGKVGKELVSNLNVSISSGDTLVEESDKRQALTKQDVSDMFDIENT